VLGLFAAVASLVGAALYLESSDPTKGARAAVPADGTYACKGPADTSLLLSLAQKWTALFSGVPVDWVLAIGKIESGHRPNCTNLTGRDLLRGGAWGFMQQTYATALGNIRALKTSTDAQVQATLARDWHGSPTNLQYPDLNVMIAVYHLSVLSRRYGGDFSKVAGAYNQGTGNMDKALAAGGIDKMTAHGQLYVQKANAARALFA
jgi:soluble lytic murein transglycosylase-like protein